MVRVSQWAFHRHHGTFNERERKDCTDTLISHGHTVTWNGENCLFWKLLSILMIGWRNSKWSSELVPSSGIVFDFDLSEIMCECWPTDTHDYLFRPGQFKWSFCEDFCLNPNSFEFESNCLCSINSKWTRMKIIHNSSKLQSVNCGAQEQHGNASTHQFLSFFSRLWRILTRWLSSLLIVVVVAVNLCCCVVSSPPAGTSQWGDGRLACWQRQQGWRHIFPGYEPKGFCSQCLIVACSWFVLNSLTFCYVSSVMRALSMHPSISNKTVFTWVQKWCSREFGEVCGPLTAGFGVEKRSLSLSSWPRRGFVWFVEVSPQLLFYCRISVWDSWEGGLTQRGSSSIRRTTTSSNCWVNHGSLSGKDWVRELVVQFGNLCWR